MFQRRRHGTVDVISGNGAVTVDTAESLARTLTECLEHAPPKAVLDLRQTPLLDSVGVEQLLDFQEMFEHRGGSMKLAAPNSLCRDILAVTGAANRFEIFGDVKSAVGSFVQ